jgi:hypothetical protein
LAAAVVFAVGETMGEAVGAGDAALIGAEGLAVFVGAFVAQPDAASSSTSAATSADGDLKIIFVTSIFIKLLRLLWLRLPRIADGRISPDVFRVIGSIHPPPLFFKLRVGASSLRQHVATRVPTRDFPHFTIKTKPDATSRTVCERRRYS